MIKELFESNRRPVARFRSVVSAMQIRDAAPSALAILPSALVIVFIDKFWSGTRSAARGGVLRGVGVLSTAGRFR